MTRVVAVVGVAIAATGLYLTYAYTGAEELRQQIYKPLYSEVAKVESAVAVSTLSTALDQSTFKSLRSSGNLERLPEDILDKLNAAYSSLSSLLSARLTLQALIVRNASAAIEPLRNASIDKRWKSEAARKLQELELSKPGTSPFRSFTLNHTGLTPTLDVRDPRNPIVVDPGGIRLNLEDWASFPASLEMIEMKWKEHQYLYLIEGHEGWQYKLTRDDLDRNKVELLDVLAPVYKALTSSKDYHQLSRLRAAAHDRFARLKPLLAGRIRTPKRIADIL